MAAGANTFEFGREQGVREDQPGDSSVICSREPLILGIIEIKLSYKARLML
jgi:hypothetical protein